MTGNMTGLFASQDASRRQASLQKALLQPLQMASQEETNAILEDLLQTGQIVFDLEPEDDDIPLEDAEKEMDADADFLADEDALSASTTSNADETTPTEDGPFAEGTGYAIRVIPLDNGRVRCEPPENTWAAARGAKNFGNTVLLEVSNRIKVLSEIARWLEQRLEQLHLSNLNTFVNEWTPASQTDFQTEREIKLASGIFSRYIRNVRLMWPDGSVPLSGCVFQGNSKRK